MTGEMGDWRVRDAAVLFGAALLLAVVAWMLGFATSLRTVQPSPPAPVGMQAPPNWAVFGEAWGYVDREFYGPAPSGRAMTQGAIEGLLAAVDDPYAALIPGGSGMDGSGELVPALVPRVGAWIQSVTDGAQVLAALPGSPAALAGLVPGDVVLGADQKAVAGKRLPELSSALGGTSPVSVTLVVRDRSGAGRSVTLTPADFPRPQVEVKRLASTALYVLLPALDAGTVAALDRQLEAVGDVSKDSLVLDLRDNPGGDLNTAAQLAGRLMEGPFWVAVRRDGTETPQPAVAPDGTRPIRARRTFVLVNNGTAGEAEMLAGALRDNAQAVLIGETTFGKGTVQEVRRLDDGSLVRLTKAYWHTPKGAKVEGVGLEPDRAVAGRQAQTKAASAAALGSGDG